MRTPPPAILLRCRRCRLTAVILVPGIHITKLMNLVRYNYCIFLVFVSRLRKNRYFRRNCNRIYYVIEEKTQNAIEIIALPICMHMYGYHVLWNYRRREYRRFSTIFCALYTSNKTDLVATPVRETYVLNLQSIRYVDTL